MGRRLRYTKWRNEQNLKRNLAQMQIKYKAEAISCSHSYNG
jgi:hypothetical protein